MKQIPELGYKYKNLSLLERALTHSSHANEMRKPDESNERLEFLGDSVLSLVVSDYLYRHHSHLSEGELTKLRASLVCEKSLHGFALELHLGDFLMLGRGERLTGGQTRPSILADAFEAVLASIYLDGGVEAARAFVLRFVKREMETNRTEAFKDYKTALQEVIQQNPEERLEYALVGESGPDHDKRFEVQVLLNGGVIGRGEGRNKKQAEQAAAREALQLMGLDRE